MIDIALKCELEKFNVPVYYMIAPASAEDNFIVITPLSNQFYSLMNPTYNVNFQVTIYNKSVMNGRILQQEIFDKFYCFSGDIQTSSNQKTFRVLGTSLMEQQPVFENDTKLYQFITDLTLLMNTR
jgi:hypothetical protein